MFGQSNWKNEVAQRMDELEHRTGELERTQVELRSQNNRLAASLKSVTKKLIMRLPISVESLEKGLNYDLIFPEELESWAVAAQEGVVLDLRSAEDFRKGHLDAAVNIPLDQLASQLKELSPQKAYLLVCENGIRSVSACEILGAEGFSFLYVLKGGMSYFQGRTVAEASELPEEALRSSERSASL